MIPFLLTQLERGAGSSAHEVRPVVPSMFEPLSPVADTETHESLALVESPLAPNQPLNPSFPWDHDQRRPAHEAHSSHRFERPALREPRESSVHTGQFGVPPGDNSFPQPTLTPAAVPPRLAETAQQPGHKSNRSETVPAPSAPVRVTPPHPTIRPPSSESNDDSPQVRSLAENVERLSRRMGTLAQPPSLEPAIRPVTSAAIMQTLADPTRPRPIFAADRSADHRGPTGLLPQHAVPQIEPPPAPTPSPTVTVSIGRIEFRHSARRSDPAPSPAPSPQRPASRVVSLEDYLLQKSAGAS